MRFKQFIESATASSLQYENAADIAAIIRRDCAPFLSESGGNFAWRGIEYADDSYLRWIRNSGTNSHDEKPTFGIGAVRNDRTPKDSSDQLHDILNDYFADKIGLPLRSTALFVLGDAGRGIAENYGRVFSVFPIGNFNYAWSRLIADATNALQFMWDGSSAGDESPKFFSEIEKAWAAYSKENDIPAQPLHKFFDVDVTHIEGLWEYNDGIWPHFVRYFLDLVDPWTFNEGLKQALGGNRYGQHEVMIVCDKYYIVSEDMMKQVMRELK